MPHAGPVLEGRTFFCPHCGALYSVTPSLVPKSRLENGARNGAWEESMKVSIYI
jgi:hypothetical protein